MRQADIGHRTARHAPAGTRCACLRLVSALVVTSLFATPAAMAAPPVGAAQPKATTLEGRNRSLAEARLQQQLAPTLEHERRLAQEYAGAGVLDAAFDHFTAALRLDPRDVPSLDGLARIWRDWGFVEAALPHAYRAVYWAPESAAAQNTLGTILLKLRLTDAARARFEVAQALDPGAAYPLNNLCYVERLRGHRQSAAVLCQRAAALDGASATVRNNLAMALAAGGDVEGAIATLSSNPSPAVAAYNEGIVRLASGRPDLARSAFARARVADPAFFPALARLTQLVPRVPVDRGN